MTSTSPRLGLPYLQPAQAQKHVTHNEALQLLDAVVQLRIAGFGAAVPPASPATGDVHAIGTDATGDWSGQDGRLALWDGTGWQFLAPAEGWLAWDAAAGGLRIHADGTWAPFVPSLQNLPGLGIGATSDATNRLSVSSPATLLAHAGAGHQLKLAKAAATDTASLLFQSAFTGHAEIGLAGDDDLSMKVSDGTSWHTALRAARATGVVTLPQGAEVNGPLTGTAVQSSPTDATPGRLLLAGAYGLGGPLPVAGNIAATDGSLVPGLHSYDTTSGSSGGPAGVTRATLLHSRRGNAAGETQLMIVESGSSAGLYPGLVLSRARSGGAWGAWTSGSVADTLSNANGRCLRSQDGTQTCWHTLTTSTTADTVWTFPQPFASATGLVVTATPSGTTGVLIPRHTAKGTASVALSVVNGSGTRVAASLDVVALGRWL